MNFNALFIKDHTKKKRRKKKISYLEGEEKVVFLFFKLIKNGYMYANRCSCYVFYNLSIELVQLMKSDRIPSYFTLL